MKAHRIITPFYIEIEFRLASTVKRGLALCADGFILLAYMYVAAQVLKGASGGRDEVASWPVILFLSIPSFFFTLIFEVLMGGQTPGKRLLQIQTVSAEGMAPSLSQYLLRHFLGFANYLFAAYPWFFMYANVGAVGWIIFYFYFSLGFTMIPDAIASLVARKGQRLGDLAAGTLVIETKEKSELSETIYLEDVDASREPVFPQVMRLSDRDINGIRKLLARKDLLRSNPVYVATISGKIKNLLELDTDLEPRDFLQQLLEDYNLIMQKS